MVEISGGERRSSLRMGPGEISTRRQRYQAVGHVTSQPFGLCWNARTRKWQQGFSRQRVGAFKRTMRQQFDWIAAVRYYNCLPLLYRRYPK